MKPKNVYKRPVIRFRKDGSEPEKRFESVKDAAEDTGCHLSTLSTALLYPGKRRAYGYCWRYETPKH